MTVEKHEPNEGTSEQGPAMEERRIRHIDFANALQENPRAKKLLFLLATEKFPSPDVADRIDTDAVLHELRMRLPTAEDVWHEATRRVQHITTERLPGQTDTDYATRNTEKQEEYLGELRRSFDAIYTSFVSEPTPPTAKNAQRALEGLATIAHDAARKQFDPSTTQYLAHLLEAASYQSLQPAEAQQALAAAHSYYSGCREAGVRVDISSLHEALGRLKVLSGEALTAARAQLSAADGTQEHNKERSGEFRPDKSTTASARAFLRYAREHAQSIDAAVARGEDLTDIIYNEFYSDDPFAETHSRDGEPHTEARKASYDAQARDLEARMQTWMTALEGAGRPLDVMQMKERGWLYFKTMAGYDSKRPVGRIYLNITPESAPAVFQHAIEKFHASGLRLEAKIPLTMTAEDIDRPDKMVIYFSDVDSEKVCNEVQKIYDAFSSHFLSETPKFTAELAGMPGVAFGENPRFGGVSFGEVRAGILAKLYMQAKAERLSLDDPKFNFTGRFQDVCRTMNVDPEHAAFNATSKGFDAIKARIKQSDARAAAA